jgi:hypothetical protein
MGLAMQAKLACDVSKLIAQKHQQNRWLSASDR